jgi:ABC-type branched-subunit amino acid transport system ATPase component
MALLPQDIRHKLAERRAKRMSVVPPEGTGDLSADAEPAPAKDADAAAIEPFRKEHGRPLVAEHLVLSYGAVTAVRDVSLVVPPGQLVGLIGPNGAGKTSTIDALTGFAPGARGSVTLGDERIDGWSAHRRARAGLVRTFQGLEIFDDLTVAENVEVARSGAGRHSPVTVASALELFGLQGQMDRLAVHLSQGERRLLALARALACSPDVLVLDEPAAGLDTEESLHLGRLLRKVVDSGVGILLVDHDMSLVLSVCDHVVVLDFGSVIASGPPTTIRRDDLVLTAYLGE